MIKPDRRISGTLEWAVENVNCVTGCSHRCRYCYAKGMAQRFKRVADDEDWGVMRVRDHDVSKRRRKTDGRVMFPTSHDITPAVLAPCLTVLGKLLTAGNDVLVVSKPHLDCIRAICERFSDHRHQILFRFTITSSDNDTLAYWEPGAPTFDERLASLRHAYESGFATSVSCEPCLGDGVALYEALAPFVTDTIWLGKMNRIRNNMVIETPDDERQRQRIEALQTDERIRRLYEALADKPLVRWKESIKDTIGLELATAAGLDV